MKRDTQAVMQKLCVFLDKPLPQSTINKIIQHTSFENMKKNPWTNFELIPGMDFTKSSFIRKGEVGDWKNHFTKDQTEYYDKLIFEKLKGSGLEFLII